MIYLIMNLKIKINLLEESLVLKTIIQKLLLVLQQISGLQGYTLIRKML